MSREVIQDFLNSAGIVGISLTNRRMRPYFYGLDAVLDRTKQALGQGVLQVVENVPEGFESFEFHFADHIVFIYKLTHGLVLLVLADRVIDLVVYRRSITKIKYLIETDTYNTVAYFKLLLGSVTQHSLPRSNWNASNSKETSKDQSTSHRSTNSNPHPNLETSISPSSVSDTRNQTNSQPQRTSSPTANTNVQIRSNIAQPQTPPASSISVPIAKVVANNNPTQITKSNTKQVSTKTGTQEYKLDELLATLNKISNFTTQYLGKVVVTNYWKSSRPDSSWLAEFEIDRNGQISYPKHTGIACTLEQKQQIQLWLTSYIKRCKQVIRNFDQMLEQDCLDVSQKQILL